jgi:cytochrome c oxidase assembly protein subunit 15
MTLAAALPSAAPRTDAARRRAVALWLLGCCAMILAMVVIGGVTRLTESGLSITEWRPVSGALPPSSEAEWQRTFELYQQIPQFQLVNHAMTLAEFKGIFWWEYVHRLWGRLIGLAFALPLLGFWLSGRLPRGLAPRLLLLLALGGLQGLVGWWMVSSGLSERIDVSQYRLTLHLALALVVHVAMLWTALDLLRPEAPALPAAAPGLRRHLVAATAMIALTMAMGGFVAGLKAGFVYNSFPLMAGQLLPADGWALEPLWRNLTENPVLAQFVHRWLAILTLAAVLALWLRSRGAGLPRAAALPLDLMAGMALLQVALGVSTLLLVVPIPLAAAHQAGAVVLLTLAAVALHGLRPHRDPPHRDPLCNRAATG